MENINIKINKKTRQVFLTNSVIGNDGENLQEKLVFSFDDEFVNGTARLELIKQGETASYIMLTKVGETYELPVKSVMTKIGKIDMQLVITEGINDEEIPIFKSNIFWVICKKSINAETIQEEDYPDFIDIAETKLNQMDNIDIEANKQDNITTITITRKDGTEETTEILDGEDGQDGVGLDYNWNGTSLGIKREDEATYDYVNLKGDKGDPGAIKMVIVNQLPSTGAEDTIYLVPLATPESQENNYAEYIYINGNWELLGKIGIQVDLTDYALKSEIPTQLSQLTDDSTHRLVSDTEKTTWGGKYDKPSGGIPSTDLSSAVQTSLGKADTAVQPTDYATSNTGGVIKVNSYYSYAITQEGYLSAINSTYSQYADKSNNAIISKGTLENVITGKELVNKTYVDTLIGDIDSALDSINGESVGA